LATMVVLESLDVFQGPNPNQIRPGVPAGHNQLICFTKYLAGTEAGATNFEGSLFTIRDYF
jgi:hypothetical protein